MNKKNSIFFVLSLMLTSVKADDRCSITGVANEVCVRKDAISGVITSPLTEEYAKCFKNQESNCVFLDTLNKCDWTYTDEMNECICEVSKSLGINNSEHCEKLYYNSSVGKYLKYECCDFYNTSKESSLENEFEDYGLKGNNEVCVLRKNCERGKYKLVPYKPLRECRVERNSVCELKGSKGTFAQPPALSDPVYSLCYVNNKDDCVLDSEDNQCKWKYSEELSQCLCVMYSREKEGGDVYCNRLSCSQREAFGYKCCTGCQTVYTDSDGDWGVETNEWCGIQDRCKKTDFKCQSEKAGVPCCDHCKVYKSVTNMGEIGYTNNGDGNIYCGIPYSCKETTTTKTTTTTEVKTTEFPTEEPTEVETTEFPTEEPTEEPTDIPDTNVCVQHGAINELCVRKDSISGAMTSTLSEEYAKCFKNQGENCIYLDTLNKCGWTYTDEMNECICEVSKSLGIKDNEHCEKLYYNSSVGKYLKYECCNYYSTTKVSSLENEFEDYGLNENNEVCLLRNYCERGRYKLVPYKPLRECRVERNSVCELKGSKGTFKQPPGLADSVYSLCYVNNSDDCVLDSEDNQCKWKYSEKLSQCLCVMNSMDKKGGDENCNRLSCSQREAFGYKCCSGCQTVYTDSDGDWGVEADEWCGIQDRCKKTDYKCQSEMAGVPCCDHCRVYAPITNMGEIGVYYDGKSNRYCGIPYSCKETTTEFPTEEPTEVGTTEFPTEEPTEVRTTEFPTEEPTEVGTTEFPTEEPTEEPTEIPDSNVCVQYGAINELCVRKDSISGAMTSTLSEDYAKCFKNQGENCIYHERFNQCAWTYTDEMNECICEVSKALGEKNNEHCKKPYYNSSVGKYLKYECCDPLDASGAHIIGEEEREIPSDIDLDDEYESYGYSRNNNVCVNQYGCELGKYVLVPYKPLRECKIERNNICTLKNSGYQGPFPPNGLADPIYSLCYYYNSEDCAVDTLDNKCKWKYTKKLSQCLCVMNQFPKEGGDKYCNIASCRQREELGEKCCSGCEIVQSDSDGDWGFEANERCGIQDRCKKTDYKCQSEMAGIPCCNHCKFYRSFEPLGELGIGENNSYCGIPYSCKTTEIPTTTTTDVTTTTEVPTEQPTTPVDTECVVTGKKGNKCVLKSSLSNSSADGEVMADPVTSLCYKNYKDNCVFDTTENKCKWQFTEDLTQCLCTMGQNKLDDGEELNCDFYTCDKNKLELSGYECCSDCSCLSHITTNSKGTWGHNEDGSKCVIPKQCEKAYNQCASEKGAIPCCDHCNISRTTLEMGEIGYDNEGNWCGIPFSCKDQVPDVIPEDFCVQTGNANELCVRKDTLATSNIESKMSEKYAKCFENQGSNCVFNDTFKRCKWNLTEEMNKCICEVSKSEGIEDDYHCSTTRYQSSVKKYLEMECCNEMEMSDLDNRRVENDDYETYGLDETNEHCVYRNDCSKGQYALIPIKPVRECEHSYVNRCSVKNSGYNNPFIVGMPNPIYGLCYENAKENCVLNENNQCEWKYDDNMNACLCELSDNTSESCKLLQCPQTKLGYKCCNKCNVVYTDNDGDWGVENDEWCGIRDSCKRVTPSKPYECELESLGYPCCDDCDYIMKSSYGPFNINYSVDMMYCGIPYSCNKE